MVNVHFSLLPRWRGAAPVERALLAGDTETGVCIMAVEEGLDTGGVYARAVVPIGPQTTPAALRDELVAAGTALLLDVLSWPLGPPVPQDGEIHVRGQDQRAAAPPRLVAVGWPSSTGGACRRHVDDAP